MNTPNFSSIGTALETLDSMEISIPLGILAKGAQDFLGTSENTPNPESGYSTGYGPTVAVLEEDASNLKPNNNNLNLKVSDSFSKTKQILKGLFEKKDNLEETEQQKKGKEPKIDKEVVLSKLFFSYLNSTRFANLTVRIFSFFFLKSILTQNNTALRSV